MRCDVSSNKNQILKRKGRNCVKHQFLLQHVLSCHIQTHSCQTLFETLIDKLSEKKYPVSTHAFCFKLLHVPRACKIKQIRLFKDPLSA